MLTEIARTGERDQLPLVDAEVGALLRVLAVATRATRILEIGTAIGYSGIWMAAALPKDGMLITMEVDEPRAKTARDNFARAGVGDRVHVVVGDAARMLHKIAGPFDLIFQDGDKAQYGPMLDRYNGVSGLVGSQGRNQSALRTRDSRHTCASLTLTGRSMTGLSSSEGSSSVTGHPRMRPTGSSFPSSEQDARSVRIRNIRAHGFGPKTKG